MKMYEASFDTIIWRFYLMMAFVIVPFLLGAPMIAILSVPIFLSALMGVSFSSDDKNNNRSTPTIYPNIESREEYKRAA